MNTPAFPAFPAFPALPLKLASLALSLPLILAHCTTTSQTAAPLKSSLSHSSANDEKNASLSSELSNQESSADPLGDDFFLEDLDEESTSVSDPLEPLNRVIFKFNDKTYRYLIRPTSKVYRWITPNIAEKGIANFFKNLGRPAVAVNEVLQGEPLHAADTLKNFTINTLLGAGGLFELKTSDRDREDFGQTLGRWGLKDGPYLVLPLLGPSSLRDGAALIVNSAMKPVAYIDDKEARLITASLEQVDNLKPSLDNYDASTEGAIEPYNAARQNYLDYRKQKVKE